MTPSTQDAAPYARRSKPLFSNHSSTNRASVRWFCNRFVSRASAEALKSAKGKKVIIVAPAAVLSPHVPTSKLFVAPALAQHKAPGWH